MDARKFIDPRFRLVLLSPRRRQRTNTLPLQGSPIEKPHPATRLYNLSNAAQCTLIPQCHPFLAAREEQRRYDKKQRNQRYLCSTIHPHISHTVKIKGQPPDTPKISKFFASQQIIPKTIAGTLNPPSPYNGTLPNSAYTYIKSKHPLYRNETSDNN